MGKTAGGRPYSGSAGCIEFPQQYGKPRSQGWVAHLATCTGVWIGRCGAYPIFDLPISVVHGLQLSGAMGQGGMTGALLCTC